MKGIILFAAAAALCAQQVGMSPIPPWPGSEERLDPELAKKYFVYLDIQTGEYVISYPEGIDRGETSGRRITVRWEPANLVDPLVRVNLSKNSDGYRYTYTVTNGPKARRSIKWFSVVVPAGDDTVRISHTGWSALRPPPPEGQPGFLRMRSGGGRFVTWLNHSAEDLARGRTINGFELRSAMRPGIVTAYAHSGTALAVREPLPGPVLDQIKPLMVPEVDYASTLTIGPKHDPQMSDGFVANDWAYGIRRMIPSRLSDESPWVRETLQMLETMMHASNPMPFAVRAAPSTEAEKELAAALTVAFPVR